MKKNLTVFILALVLSGAAMAQDDAPNKIIKTNPIGLAIGNINLTFEFAISQAISFEVGASYFNRLLGVDVSGFGADAGMRFYITNSTKPAPEGFYVGPRVAFSSLTDNTVTNGESFTTFGIGALLGYQWIFKSGVSLDLGAGPTYTFASSETSDVEGIVPNLTFAVGYAF